MLVVQLLSLQFFLAVPILWRSITGTVIESPSCHLFQRDAVPASGG